MECWVETPKFVCHPLQDSHNSQKGIKGRSRMLEKSHSKQHFFWTWNQHCTYDLRVAGLTYMRSAWDWVCHNFIMHEEYSWGSSLIAGGMCAIFLIVAIDKVLSLMLKLLKAVITEYSGKARERHKSRMETTGMKLSGKRGEHKGRIWSKMTKCTCTCLLACMSDIV